MSVNSSSSSNASLPPSFISSNFFAQNCLRTPAGARSATAFTITNIIFLLPLYILVLYLGLQRWRQQRSGTSMSHSDLFTYNIVITELINVVGSTLISCGIHTDLSQMTTVGGFLRSMNSIGQLLFHILTCVERYLAVVHPITYLSLRKAKGIRIRNVTIGCVWLLCFAVTGLLWMEDHMFTFIMSVCITASSFIAISFCSLSVLCVLIRPGPGEGAGGRQQVDRSKMRAFYTIMAILGVLLLRLVGYIFTIAVSAIRHEKCALWSSVVWFCLPSSLVLPLLFLHRAGKLPCCKSDNKSGQD